MRSSAKKMQDTETLKTLLQNNQHYVELCTIAVFIGLLIEYLPELLKWKKHSRIERTALIAGLVLIAGGVFGEYFLGARSGTNMPGTTAPRSHNLSVRSPFGVSNARENARFAIRNAGAKLSQTNAAASVSIPPSTTLLKSGRAAAIMNRVK